MLKNTLVLLLFCTFCSLKALAAGQIQDSDVKSLSQLTAGGGSAAQLINDTKIYVTGGGINQQLSAAITNGLIGGGGGGKNYLSAYTASIGNGQANLGNGDFENGSTTGWSLAHSALTNLLPTSTAAAGNAFSSTSGGTAVASGLTFTTVTTNTLQKKYSGNLAATGASTAGDMLISSPFYIDSEDRAKVLTFKFFYQVASGTLNLSGTSANSYAVYLYDVQAGAWSQPAQAFNIVQGTGVGLANGTFQTSSTATQYQLAIVNINSNSAATSLLVDDFSVSPVGAAQVGAVITPWVQYTPTVVGFGTITSPTVFSRRVGENLEVRGFFNAGTPTAVTNTMTIGYNGVSGNVNINTNILGNSGYAGDMTSAPAASTTYRWATYVASTGTTNVSFGLQSSTVASQAPNQTGSTLGITAGNSVLFGFSVPITGWAGTTTMSSETDTRSIVFAANSITGSLIGAAAPGASINFGTATSDSAGGWNGSTTYVIPISGYYDISGYYNINFGGNTVNSTQSIYLMKNGSLLHAFNNGLNSNCCGTSNVFATPFAWKNDRFNAGDQITINAFSNPGTASLAYNFGGLFVTRVSGPAVIAATESVAMNYTDTSAGTISTAGNTYTYATKNFDSHNAYSGGVYTCPVSGKYQVDATMITGSITLTGTQNTTLAVTKNGTQIAANQTNGTGQANGYQTHVYTITDCPAGTQLAIKASSGVATTGNTASGYNNLSISRVGN